MNSKICILGDVVTDITLPQDGNEIKIRLGGITHCARGLWAMDIPYDAKFVAPNYLSKSIVQYYNHHGANEVVQIGTVIGAPYSFLIGSVKETGNQFYDFVLRDQIEINLNFETLNSSKFDYTDLIIISGNFDLNLVSSRINKDAQIHIDLSNNIENFEQLTEGKYNIIFLSTSSEIFKNYYKGSFLDFCKLFENHCKILVLKENRGGSRIFDFEKKENFKIPSITQPIVHSVGVGDVFDACFVSKYRELGIEKAGYLASWIASEYALTTFPDDFKLSAQRVLNTNIEDILSMGGCILPWENRPLFNIYIAAPDFDYIDRKQIDLLANSLSYHNFSPRRPVQENGQLSFESTKEEKALAYSSDIELLKKCKLLIVVYLYEDPGTLIELGFASALGIPCLVYDPYNKANNCILTEIPNIISNDLDTIISEVFNHLSKLNE